MSMLNVKDISGYISFDEAECRAVGKSRAGEYTAAKPYPSIVIDDFLPISLLRQVHAGYPSSAERGFFNNDQERLKYQYSPDESSSPVVRNLLAELNGRAFIGFLEELTGIKGLVGDPYFHGGGLHETKRGGHLGVHADFNVHPDIKLQRRLNLLVYLNDDWSPDYKGELELWDTRMKACQVSVAPIMGRAVVFATDLDSYHGQPDPVDCPPDRSRRSIATYYYTAIADGYNSVSHKTTNFRARPGTADVPVANPQRDNPFKDWVPPKLYRYAKQLASRR
jgi:Rps23 Pro-64 3,4-dihydroxylase Tpa1-like proline 4-hydroxylase